MSTIAPLPPRAFNAESQERRPDDDFTRLMSKNARIGSLYRTLSAAERNIEAMLPDFMKGQGDRLIRRACITFSKNPDLHGISDEDYRRCVIEAAEMGFAIDGRLCYVVKYKNTYQVQLDYKAMVAVAKRCRTIKDIDTDVVRDGDHFKHGRYGGTNVLEHTFDVRCQDRGEVIAAYCRVFLPDGSWNYEVMTRSQLDAIQRRAPAQNGPWKTDTDEMRRKTVLRRKLKLYQDDPGLMRMLEITGENDSDDDANEVRPATLAALDKALTTPRQNGNGHTNGNGHAEPDEPTQAEPPAETHVHNPTPNQPDPDLRSFAEMTLAEAQSLTDVEAVRATLDKRATTDTDRAMAAELCDARAEAIRATRGSRSNANK